MNNLDIMDIQMLAVATFMACLLVCWALCKIELHKIKMEKENELARY